MAYIMKIVGLAAGGETPFDNHYLVDYDPDIPGYDKFGREMLIHLAVTEDADKAKRFDSLPELTDEWSRTISKDPVRPDGKPNCPLKAFTITPVKVGDPA